MFPREEKISTHTHYLLSKQNINSTIQNIIKIWQAAIAVLVIKEKKNINTPMASDPSGSRQ